MESLELIPSQFEHTPQETGSLDTPQVSPTETKVKLLKPQEVADWLGVKRKTLDVWRHKGTGPAFIKRFRRIRYQPEAVVRWLLAKGEHVNTLQAYLANQPAED